MSGDRAAVGTGASVGADARETGRLPPRGANNDCAVWSVWVGA